MAETTGIADDVLNLGGTQVRFRFSTLAVAHLQKHWNLETPDDAIAQLSKIESDPLNVLPVILWAGLRRFHPETSLEQCIEYIDDVGFKGIPELTERIIAITKASFPQAEGGKPRPQQAPKRRGR